MTVHPNRSPSCTGTDARDDSDHRTPLPPSVGTTSRSSAKCLQEAPRGFSADRRESPRPLDYMKGRHSQRGLRRGPRGDGAYRMARSDHRRLEARPPWAVAVKVGKKGDNPRKSTIRLYARAVPGMHRAGPGERGGGSYGRRAVATAKWAAMQISGAGKGLILL